MTIDRSRKEVKSDMGEQTEDLLESEEHAAREGDLDRLLAYTKAHCGTVEI